MITIMFAFTMSLILILINSLIAKKSMNDREKMSPFECGFDPKSSSRLPFSMRFYMIALIFLIFDIEITLILPMPVTTTLLDPESLMTLFSFFITILLLGIFHEWNEGALEWNS